MAKRVKYDIGDVFLIELENELKGIGRVIKKYKATVFINIYKKLIKNIDELNFNELINEDILYMKWCYDDSLKKEIWKIVGNIVVEENFQMPYFWTEDNFNHTYYLIKGGDTPDGEGAFIKVDKEEIKNAYVLGVAYDEGIPERIMYKFKEIGMI